MLSCTSLGVKVGSGPGTAVAGWLILALLWKLGVGKANEALWERKSLAAP